MNLNLKDALDNNIIDEEFEIPNVTKLANDIIEIMEYVIKNNLNKLEIDEKMTILENAFPECSKRYYSVLHALMSKCDIDNLICMLRSLYKIQKNENSLENEVNILRNMLQDKYPIKK